MKNFALIGSAGYVAPRHLQAIRETGNRLVAALDLQPASQTARAFFPDAHWFTSFDMFEAFLRDFQQNGNKLDYVTVCSPNHLHDAHVRFGLTLGADVICEKPVVLSPAEVDSLLEAERQTRHHVFTILQLRMHPAARALREKVMAAPTDKKFEVSLTYISARDEAYYQSWKGDAEKSGGIVTNIGIHFFDLLQWIFGHAQENTVTFYSDRRAEGLLQLEKATVRWALGTDAEFLPEAARVAGMQTYRTIRVDDALFDISQGSADLHVQSYEAILAGQGISLTETRPVISLVHAMRHSTI